MGFYKSYGRPIAKVFLGAVFTYQAVYWLWVKLETDEIKERKKSEAFCIIGGRGYLADIWYCRRDFAIGSTDSRCTGEVDIVSYCGLERFALVGWKAAVAVLGGGSHSMTTPVHSMRT